MCKSPKVLAYPQEGPMITAALDGLAHVSVDTLP